MTMSDPIADMLTRIRNQYMKNFHYPKPVRCFRIGNPDDTTSYSIVTLKGKQTLPAMEELIRLLRESA